MGLMVILLSTFGLFGCENYVELENRSFIMAIGIDSVGNGQYRLTYALPDLAKLTGNGSSDKESPISIEAGSLEEAEKIFNRMSEKVMDYGQVKVFVFGNNLVSDMDGIEKLVHEIKNKQEVARTVLVPFHSRLVDYVIDLDVIGFHWSTSHSFSFHWCANVLCQIIYNNTDSSRTCY